MSANRTVAVISGGSSGIGRAFVAQLYTEGVQLIALARDETRLSRLAVDFPGVETAVCDVTAGARRGSGGSPAAYFGKEISNCRF